MFTAEESNNLKLIDFGLARKLNAEKDLKILFGTPEFVGKRLIYKLSTAVLIDLMIILLNEILPKLNSDPISTAFSFVIAPEVVNYETITPATDMWYVFSKYL